MKDDDIRHERVWFRDREIADLGNMPSAFGQPEMRPDNRAGFWFVRICLGLVAGCIALVALAWVGIGLIGSTSFASDQLRTRVESAIRRAAGPNVSGDFAAMRLGFDGGRLLALDLDGFGLKKTGETASILQARELSFGLRLWPLLFGQIELANATISGASISVNGLSTGGPGWLAGLMDERGLVIPDRAPPAVFAALDELVGAVRRGAGSEVSLSDVTVAFGDGQSLTFKSATATSSPEELLLTAETVMAGQAYTLEGLVAVSATGEKATDFSLKLTEIVDADGKAATMTISGVRGKDGAPSRLVSALDAPGRSVDLGRRGIIAGDLDLRMRMTEGEGKLEVETLEMLVGRSRLHFDGAISPMPETSAANAYRFELVSNDSVISPEDSTEPPMPASIKLAGTYTPQTSRVELADIRIRASTGEASGTGAYVIAPGMADAIKLDLGLKDMSVAQVKQIWPWFAGANARRWVMQKFFSGEVLEGSVRFDVAAGRLDDPSPLSADEVSGRFVVAGSRFDTAGVMPPVRDAVGSVQFAGARVEATLQSGAAFMESGRQVALREGTLLIEDTRAKPLIGRLTMKLAGSADALADLAGHEPINAMRTIDLLPEDLSGDVEGEVQADIPLQKGIDRKMLDWRVALDYRNLAIGKLFAGQKIEQATGSIVLQPQQAVVDAKARLNGIPAELSLVQPLGGSAVPVKRDIVLVLDDKTRADIAPGLNTMVAGTIRAAVDGAAATRTIQADLTSARLTLPWAGWSKGAGIPAKVTFVLSGEAGNRRIKDFRLTGKSFSASGDIDISDGFRSARMNSVKLNPGDDFSVDVIRQGRGFNVTVTGSALDARGLIKQMTSPNTEKPANNAGIVVSAAIGSLIGFNDEILKDVRVRFRGGAGGGGTSIAGRTSGGAAFSMDDAREGETRRISASSANAGVLLRFLNLYGRMDGGALKVSLAGNNALRGTVEVRDFDIVNEPKLNSVVSTQSGPSGNLDAVTNKKINTARVRFDRGFAEINKTATTLKVDNAVLRGPVIGTTFEGTVYDADNRTNLTGTFMPAYGINSIFGDIPLLGAFLGGGENGGLIGVTYRLRGNLKTPTLEVNPLSAIAPGMFRKIFEY